MAVDNKKLLLIQRNCGIILTNLIKSNKDMTLAPEHLAEQIPPEPGTAIMDILHAGQRVASGQASLSPYQHPSFPTGFIPSPSHKWNLPPAAPDIYSGHDLVAEAEAVLRQASEQPAMPADERALPPLTSYEDSMTVINALRDTMAMKRMVDKYGQDVYDQTIGKTRAMAEINAATTYQLGEKEAVEQYKRIRRGQKLAVGLPPLLVNKSDLDAIAEEPFHEIPDNPLAYEGGETELVIDALRFAAVSPDKQGIGLSAKELLSRYAPTPTQRAFYQFMLENAGVHLDIAEPRVPEYK